MPSTSNESKLPVPPADCEPSKAEVANNRFWKLFRNAFRLRCPVCKRGRIFSGLFRVEERCPVCGIVIEREPGYFLGSIYFNYGATSVLSVTMYLTFRLALDWPDSIVMPLLTIFTIGFPCWFHRYARSCWLVLDQYFQPRTPPEIKQPAAPRDS